MPSHLRNGHLSLGRAHGNLHHLLASSLGAATARLTALCLLDTIIVIVVSKEARTCGTRRGALHLPWEVAVGKDTGSFAETVGDLVGIDTLEGDPNSEARSSDVILDKNELALLGLWNVREQVVRSIGIGPAAALNRNGAASVGSHVRHWRTSRIRLVVVTGKDVSRPYIFVARLVLTSGNLMVMFVAVAIT